MSYDVDGEDDGLGMDWDPEAETGPEEGEAPEDQEAEDPEDTGPLPDAALTPQRRPAPRPRPRPRPAARPAPRRRRKRGGIKRLARKAVRKGLPLMLPPTALLMGVADDPTCRDLTFDVYRTGSGFSGVIRIPTNIPGKALAIETSVSPTKAIAARKAQNLAAKAARNPLIQAALPPQARLALKAARSPLARAAFRAAAKTAK